MNVAQCKECFRKKITYIILIISLLLRSLISSFELSFLDRNATEGILSVSTCYSAGYRTSSFPSDVIRVSEHVSNTGSTGDGVICFLTMIK